jgi:lipopolysaccharide transport system ATP-binding protein
MSSNIAIKVENLSKFYQIYEKPHDRLKQSILPRLIQLFGKGTKQYFREFSALKDVSFEVKKGQTVGIIGQNGSGKSTLLQMICGTLNPTQGNIQVNGRVAALLELGAGFNPEFTGRENIFTNGALLGLSKDEIEKKFDAILAFADIGLFIDQPVKTYSSGMFVRLAFAIAANLEPDVLIIDEALAVGDMAFQAKCMARIRSLMDRGTTVLFVSHDLGSVRNICQRVLWLKGGQQIAFGDPKIIVDSYVREMNEGLNQSVGEEVLSVAAFDEAVNELIDRTNLSNFEMPQIPFAQGYKKYGNEKAAITDALLYDLDERIIDTIDLHAGFIIRAKIKCKENISAPVFGFSFRDLKGNQVIGGLNTNFSQKMLPSFLAGAEYMVEIRGKNCLAQGVYTLTVGLEDVVDLNKVHQFVDIVEDVRVFRSSFGSDTINIFPAMVWERAIFTINKIN